MRFRLLLIYLIILRSYADLSNNMIVDYFNHKEVSSVVGFPCYMTQVGNSWLLRQLSKVNIRTSLNTLDIESVVTVIGIVDYWKLGIFVDTRCYDEEKLYITFSKISDAGLFGDLYNWLIIGYNLSTTLSFIDDRTFGLSTDFVIAVSISTDIFELYDVYNIFKERGSILNVSYFGNWNQKNSITPILTQSKYERRANLHKLLLKVMFFKNAYKSANDSLEEYLDDNVHATRDSRSKFGYQIVKHLADLYNFTIEVMESWNWAPGDPLGPLAKALANNSVDIAGSPLTMTVSRTYILKYVHQDWPFRTCFIFRNPQQKNIKIQEILRPLSGMTWYLMGVVQIIGITILTLALRLDYNKSFLSTMSDSFITVMGALCQQGSHSKMKRLSVQIIFLVMMIFSLLMYNYYSASVVSARLDEPILKINDSLNELSKLNLKFASEWMVYLEFFLKFPDWEVKQFYHNIWLKVPESKKFIEPEIGIKLVREGGFAYHLHPEVGYPFIDVTFNNREICELMEVHLARPSFTALSVTMNSSIVDIMRIGLAKISEVGLRDRQINIWQYKKPQCRNDILRASSITIDEFSPHLIVLIMGIISAILVLIAEILFVKNNIDLCFKAEMEDKSNSGEIKKLY